MRNVHEYRCVPGSKNEEESHETELPLWKSREKPVFEDIQEAIDYGNRLVELITMLDA